MVVKPSAAGIAGTRAHARSATTGPATTRPWPPGSGQPRPPEAVTIAEAVQAAEAVLGVAGALARYLAEVGVQGRRAALRRMPTVAVRPPVQLGRRASLLHRVAATGSTAVRAVGAVADVLVPGAVRAVLTRIDVTALVQEFVDLDRLAGRLDVDAVVARVDIDRIIDRVDVDAVIDRVDLDRVVGKVDIGRVIDRVDVDAVIDRVDVDRVVGKVDIDRVIDRADIVGLARYVIQETDMATLLRESTGSVTSEMMRGVRDQGAGADQAVARIVDRLLRRHGTRSAPGADERTDDGTQR